jgi:hypothetical protein
VKTTGAPGIKRRIRQAGLLIGLGLLVQLLTFVWIHPLAFLTFLTLGCPLVAAGVLLYLYSLAMHEERRDDS